MIYHTKETKKFYRRYVKWDVAVITENFYGLLSYSCYFSAVEIPDVATMVVDVTTTDVDAK